MPTRFRAYQPDQKLLMPVTLNDSVPEGRLAHRAVSERRIARRAVLGLPASPRPVQRAELTLSQYAGWMAHYRRGRLIEVAPQVWNWRTGELLSVQRRYLDAVGQPDKRAKGKYNALRAFGEHKPLHVFQATLTTALFHAELIAQFGAKAGHGLDLIGAPLHAIPTTWPLLARGGWHESAREAWGERRVENLRALLRREIFLMAARSRLAQLDNASARQVLEFASAHGDPAVEWQFATSNVIQARYLRDGQLWSDAQRGLRRGAGEWEWSLADMGASRRSIVQAMGDPDDLHLRLAMVALGRRRYRAAAAHLEVVGAEVAPRLRVPRLLLQAELDLRAQDLPPAIEDLQMAARFEPTSPAAVVALVAAQQAAGRWDEAAALASDFLSVRAKARPWLAFITTWAEFGEGLPWLRRVAGIA